MKQWKSLESLEIILSTDVKIILIHYFDIINFFFQKSILIFKFLSVWDGMVKKYVLLESGCCNIEIPIFHTAYLAKTFLASSKNGPMMEYPYTCLLFNCVCHLRLQN
jgi:hypothetical protein